MVASLKGLGHEKDCAGKGQQRIQKTDSSSQGIVCCTEPGLTEALYILHIRLHNNCKLVNICSYWQRLLLSTMTDKWQTRPLVREDAPHGQDCTFHTRRNIWSWASVGARHQDRQTDWPSVVMWLWLVREGAPQKQDRNCQTVIYICSWAPDGARHQDLLTVSRNVTLTLTLTLT
jgi:hypothetical protein